MNPDASSTSLPPRALVTGASAGIGLAMAHELAARGWALVITARSVERLEALADELRSRHGIAVQVIAEDLADPAAPARLDAATEGAGLAVDLLVNNAGFGRLGPLVEQEVADATAMVQVNVTAVTELSRRFGAHMAGRGRGRILNVASTAAFQPGPLMAVYYATKAYVLSFSEAIRSELSDRGVSVTCLCPGVTRSEFHERAGMDGSTVLERLGAHTAESVARAGIRGALRGRRLVVPGVMNRVLTLVVRASPRGIVPPVVRRMQEARR